MTNQSPEGVIAEALNAWPRVSESSPNLGVADYLTEALRAANMLREPGEPDWEYVGQDECAVPGHTGCTRVMVDGEPWFDHFPAERDAALAAIERVRARLGDILPDWSDSGVIAVADILAALDWAPEPEVGS